MVAEKLEYSPCEARYKYTSYISGYLLPWAVGMISLVVMIQYFPIQCKSQSPYLIFELTGLRILGLHLTKCE